MKTLFVFFLVFALAGCTSKFEQMNVPPTSYSEVDPGILFAKAQRDGNFLQSNEYPDIVVGSWIQQWNTGFNLPASRYIFQPSSWTPMYAVLRNLSQIRNHPLKGKENDPSGRTKLAMAKIVEIDQWQDITDMWGDIPFSESALGVENVISQPKFDTQESIYKQLIKDIDVAIGSLTAGDQTFGAYDLYYNGDIDKWRKYGNAVKLQLAMRIKYADPVLSKATALSALGAATIASNADNAMIKTFTNLPTSYHPVLAHFTGGSPDLKYLGETLINKLVSSDDPRLPLIADPTVNSVKAGAPKYVGKKAAQTDNEMTGIINDDYSLASKKTYFNLAITSPIPWYVFTYAEICFYKAEIALEGWAYTPDDVEKFYQEGIRAAMAQKPYDITVIPAAFIAKEFSLAGLTSEQKLEKIMTQKWISLFGRNYDAYSEWRRTGYPKLIPGNNQGSTGGKIPRRFGYPSDEVLLNEKNYKEAVARMTNGDSYLSRVWWDKRPL